MANPTQEIAPPRSQQIGAGAVPYALRRLGIVMRPASGDPHEAGGVLNPGGARGPDGSYLLFPRLVAAGNYSRIGVARVLYDDHATPIGVERLGIALEPEAEYEKNTRTGGGCEDPRVTYVPALQSYLMTYVAYGPTGPRVALAASADLVSWRRLGLVAFAPEGGGEMDRYANKDALIFPEPVPGPDGRPSIAMLHRPMYEVWEGGSEGKSQLAPLPPGVSDRRWSIWISYCPLEQADWASPHPGAPNSVPTFGSHSLVIGPDLPWEALRIGGGTPPVRLDGNWFTIYHGIGMIERLGGRPGLRYVAAALILDAADTRRVLYRSPEPIMAPELPEERSGVVSDVVFPTAVDQHDGYLDVYYGMADACIGVARMDLEQSGA